MLHDIFICHASEDKDDFVRPLAEALRARYLDVWYDEFSLTVGESLSERIDQGLARSNFGLVVLSPHFFRKNWTKRELSGLVAREMAGERGIILPIWHRIGRDEILRHSPPLADVVAISSARGIDVVVVELLKKLRPGESPLVVARDFLVRMGDEPPIVTDEWWLDMLEIKEAELRFPTAGMRQWIFPLPFSTETNARERGLNIAWTSLQTDWSADGEERGLCQLTHPDQIHEFLREWPGLLQCARDNPGVLAMYVPQLTIPGFDTDFIDVFDALLDPTREDAYELPGYGGGPDTIDGNEPLCGELIAWRHASFGNYTDRELAYSFVHAHDGRYSRQSFRGFECLTWLLAADSYWMPKNLKEKLVEGMRSSDFWFREIMGTQNAFVTAFLHRGRSKFNLTREIRTSIVELFANAIEKLGIQEDPSTVTNQFIECRFIEGLYDEEDRIRQMRKKR